MNTAAGDVPAAASGADARALTTAAAIVAMVLAGDLLLWGAKPGLSLGLFTLLLGGMLFVHGVRTRRSGWAAGLLALTAIQFSVEVCFTGVACATALLVVLLGETAFPSTVPAFARWMEAASAIALSPGRWFSFGRTLIENRRVISGVGQVTPARLGNIVQIVLPAAALVLVFGLLLGSGNAVFGDLATRAGWQLSDLLLTFDWSPARFVLWMGLIGLGIALLWPPGADDRDRWWTRTIPKWTRPDVRVAFWQSALALLATNALFFAANTIDAVYLWSHGALPAGVNASAFLHDGVHSLIAAVALAALVLAAIFQQSAPVTGSRLLRGLALAWIAQNLVLIGSVLLRLKLYVDAYQLSELRVYVACFLALVTLGFFLLAQHVARGMQLGLLIRQNLAAAFGLFFILQFPDVGRVVADFNVRHWQENPGRTLDLTYLRSLGPGGWPALMSVARSNHRPSAAAARDIARAAAASERDRLENESWRAIQWRRNLAARRLLSEVAFL